MAGPQAQIGVHAGEPGARGVLPVGLHVIAHVQTHHRGARPRKRGGLRSLGGGRLTGAPVIFYELPASPRLGTGKRFEQGALLAQDVILAPVLRRVYLLAHDGHGVGLRPEAILLGVRDRLVHSVLVSALDVHAPAPGPFPQKWRVHALAGHPAVIPGILIGTAILAA